VLNTHCHGDHTALNEAFRRRFGAEIVNQRTSPAPAEGRWFEGPRRRVLMLPIGGCHSGDDCCVWVETDRALFTGDLFGWGMIPTMGLDAAAADRLMAIYARLIDFDAVTVIPGHGPLCTPAELKRFVEYFHWLLAEVGQACAAGQSETEAVEAIPPPEDMTGWWRFVSWKHGSNVSKVFAAVRAGRLGPGGNR
jgi:glyoxylase-like metal-dependent hydrolase (beta-lactamase superfamily II)